LWYRLFMANVTISVDDEILAQVRKSAEAMGKSLNQLIREYLEGIANPRSRQELAEEFVRLSYQAKGDPKGWKFNREEIYEDRIR
jgi:hypothetical protein